MDNERWECIVTIRYGIFCSWWEKIETLINVDFTAMADMELYLLPSMAPPPVYICWDIAIFFLSV